MGNAISGFKQENTEKDFQHFYHILDYIATYYILTMNFKSLTKLSEKSYCDKLVVLTSDIIEKYFNENEITYLYYRTKNGIDVNEMKTDKMIYFNKDILENLDVSMDEQKSIRKKRVCLGIAKFYIRIAHIFAAIITTINPIYAYRDENGNMAKVTLLEKDKIPRGVEKKLYKVNICDNRIRALKKNHTLDISANEVSIQPKVCDINLNKSGSLMTLNDEPGIPELEMLYFDDNYDYSTGIFTGMSDSTKKQFKKDLKMFYTAFTGNDIMPDTIESFRDIKLRDYSVQPECMKTYENKEYQYNPMPNIPDNPMQNMPDNPMPDMSGNLMQNMPDNPMPDMSGNPMPNMPDNPMSDMSGNPMPNMPDNPMSDMSGNPMPDNLMSDMSSNIARDTISGGGNDRTGIYRKSTTISKNDKLFIEYANNINKMIQNSRNNQNKLLDIINELFVYMKEPYTDKLVIRVKPTLTEDNLQTITEKTRKIILNLYIQCEKDYVHGVKIYEAIVEKKILETTQNQIMKLEEEAKNITNSIGNLL
jgi:hypothetical protein